MSNPEIASLLRAILDETCKHVALSEVSVRTHVAVKLLESNAGGARSLEELRAAGKQALRSAPAMWR